MPATEDFAEKHRNVLFSNNVTATLREMPGGLYPLCGNVQGYSGNKAARIENRFGRLRMSESTTRNGDTNNVDVDSLVRFIVPGKSANVAPLVDPDDADTTSVELGSPILKEVADAAATYHDDMFSRGFWGNGWTGEAGNVAVPFKAANVIVHGATGLTQGKLLATRELMRKRHINFQREKPIIVLQPEDVTDLMEIPEYKSFDYNGSKPLVDGELKPWLGFRFLEFTADSESLPLTWASWFTDSGVTRQLPVIVRSGMHRGVWAEFEGSIDDRADKNHSTQFWGRARSACVRTDEDKAFVIQTR
jgi:hypothetical protein